MLTRRLLVVCCIALIAGLMSTGADEAAIDVEIVVSPNVLALGSAGVWVTIHTDIAYSAVDRSTCAVEMNEIAVPVAWTKSDSCGNLVVKIRQAAVEDVVSPGPVTVVLTGLTKASVPFAGSDTIRVKA